MSRLAVLHQHWILNLTTEGQMIYPVTTLREQVFRNYLADVYPWATVEQKKNISQAFKFLPNILESLCPA